MKTGKMLQVLTLSLAIMLSLLTFCASSRVAAEEVAERELETVSLSQAEPLGIFTSLSLSINCDSRQVWATVKNDVSIFLSTVKVYVELYSSVTYKSSYQNMTLESRAYVSDLDMGKSLTTYALIDGVKRYWIARVYYKVGSKDWAEKMTGVWLIDVDGSAMMV